MLHCAMNLTLLVPDLFLPQPPGGMLDLYHDLHTPDLAWLFARATLQPSQGSSLETFLLDRFGIRDSQSVASFTRLADSGTPDAAYCLRADPVHLQAQRDQLVLIDGETIAITPAEAEALTTALNQHFAQDDLRFIFAHPNRWYLTLDTTPDLVTHPLPHVAGNGINRCLPQGSDGLRWNQRMTEIQMLLYTHPVNEAREAQGLPTINSVWFWGGGKYIQPARISDLSAVWANDALARGLAMATGLPQHALPENFAALSAQASSHPLVVWDGLRQAAWYGDYAAWRAGLMRLEQQWIKPALQALRQGGLKQLTLHAISEHACLSATLTPSSRWQFWRRAKPLSHYLPHAQ